MKVSVTEFKSKCLAILTRVHQTHEPVEVLKRGKPIVRVMPVAEDKRPWIKLRGRASWVGDLVSPAISAKDLECLKNNPFPS